jgi:hypothetical protein
MRAGAPLRMATGKGGQKILVAKSIFTLTMQQIQAQNELVNAPKPPQFLP